MINALLGAVDALKPVKWSMAEWEQSAADFMKDKQNLNLDKTEKPKVSVSDKVPKNDMYIDWDKQQIVSVSQDWTKNVTPISKVKDLDIANANKPIDSLGKKEKVIAEKLKDQFIKLKAKWVKVAWEALNPKTYWELVKKNPKLSATAAILSPVMIGILSEDEETTPEAPAAVEPLTPVDTDTMYKDRTIWQTRWGWFIYTGKDWQTRTFKTLEEAKAEIDKWLGSYYKDEYQKAIEAKDEVKIAQLIEQAKERWIDLDEWLAL